MHYKHLRHATGILEYGGKEILIDPMLAKKNSLPPIPDTPTQFNNPMSELPLVVDSFNFPKITLITHLHFDHFDHEAVSLMPEDTKIICQKEDSQGLRYLGFSNLVEVDTSVELESISIERVVGKHGNEPILSMMGISSGYIFRATNEPTLFLTGDTILTDHIANTIKLHQPEVIIAFAGGAQFNQGGPITLKSDDLINIHKLSPSSKIICTHLDAINHCIDTRALLSEKLNENHLDKTKFLIPQNGEYLKDV